MRLLTKTTDYNEAIKLANKLSGKYDIFFRTNLSTVIQFTTFENFCNNSLSSFRNWVCLLAGISPLF